jgi:general secretion pathway protein D
MKNVGHLVIALLLSFVAPTAHAQDDPPVPRTLDALRRPAIKGIKPSPLPAQQKVRLPPMVQGKDLAPLAQKVTPGPAKRPTPVKKGRTPAPGANDDKDDGAKGGDAKKPPQWQQVEEKEDEEPTLSKDFIKNCARLRPGVKVRLDIYDEEIEAVVKLMACLTGKNIVIAKALKGKKITIYSPSLVTAREAEKVFFSALEANGLTILPKGKFWHIIEANVYQKSPGPILGPDTGLPNDDRMVTQLLRLQYVDAGEMNQVITELATPNAKIIVYQPTNSLIITELASNLIKLKKLLAELDQPGGQEQLWVYQVLNADASDIAAKITEVFEREGGARTAPAAKKPAPRVKKGAAPSASAAKVGDSDLDVTVSKVIADERTNRLLVVATARSYRKVKKLIERLDIAIPGDGQVHIHQLNHAKAADLATVLGNLSNEQRSRTGAAGARRPTPRAKAATGGAKAATGATSAALFEGEVQVTADEDTNALVITASLKDYLSLKKVIDVLDRPRRQVFIEAIIMEVSTSNTRSFGIAMHGATEVDVAGETLPLVFSNQVGPGSILSAQNAATLTGLAVQSASTVAVPGLGDLPAFGVILQALAESNDVNVLSTPHILTTDNEEAEIVVGNTVPYRSGGIAGLSAVSNLGDANTNLGNLGGFVQVQRLDVELSLKITPRINAANFVTLEIDQVVEEIESNSPDLGPATSKRSVKSTVVVKDQNTVVIGGLQKSSQRNRRSMLPLLGEIPVIGYLFRDSGKDQEQRNLLLMLTPYVIEGPEDFRAIFKRKMEEHREFAARFRRDEDGDLTLGIDYGKKHGVLEAIHQTLVEAREEEALLEQLRRSQEGPPLPQELDGLEEALREAAEAEALPPPPPPPPAAEPAPAPEDAP